MPRWTSRSMRTSERVAAVLLACGAAGIALAEDPAPAQWLERMNQALTTRNYDGTFTHWHGGSVEMLRIIHRVQDGVVSERLVSLDGSGREFIRTGANLTCYLPDQRTVLVEQRPPQEPLVGFPSVNDQTASFYDIRRSGAPARTAATPTSSRCRPRTSTATATGCGSMTPRPCRCRRSCATRAATSSSRSCSRSSSCPRASPTRSSSPTCRPLASSGCATTPRRSRRRRPQPRWNAMQLPPGFRMTMRSAQTMPGSAALVDHLVFTDGLASVSVFVETQQARGTQNGEPEPPRSAPRRRSRPWSTATR